MTAAGDKPHLPQQVPIEGYGKGGFRFGGMTQRLNPALGHHLDRQAAVEIGRGFPFMIQNACRELEKRLVKPAEQK